MRRSTPEPDPASRKVDFPSGPSRPVIIGHDPGLGFSGSAVVRLGREPKDDEVLSLHVWETEKSDKKRSALASDDNMRRAVEVAGRLVFLHAKFSPAAVCAESMSFPRNSSAAAKVALFWGALACEQARRGFPFVQLSPQAVRQAFGLAKGLGRDEGKAALHALLLKRYGAKAVGKRLEEARAACPSARTAKQWEERQRHPMDALAVCASADTSEIVRLLRAGVSG